MILTNESIKAIQEKTARYPRAKSAILPAITIAYRQVGHLNDEIYLEISDVIGVPALEIAVTELAVIVGTPAAHRALLHQRAGVLQTH